jgi:Contractile injection system tube protein
MKVWLIRDCLIKKSGRTPMPQSSILKPRLIKGEIMAIDPRTKRIDRRIPFQYNPDSLSRSLQIQVAEGEGNARAEALRLKGAPIETFRIEIEIDATDRLETAESTAIDFGIHPQLAALETLVYPDLNDVIKNMSNAANGALEIVPLEAPMTLFIWGKQRLPVRITELSVTEDAYDINLNPIRAKVSLSLRVLTYDDLPWKQLGSDLFVAHHRAKRDFANLNSPNPAATKVTQIDIPGL